MTPPDRTEPPHLGAERDVLAGFLDFQRQTVLWKVSGLTRDQLTQRFVESKTTMLGVVKHLIDVERSWFTVVFQGGVDEPYFWETAGVFDSEFDINDSDEPEAILEMYRRECESSRLIVAHATSLDDIARDDKHDQNLRWILAHMIEETARHVGHLDILREMTDGTTGE